MKNLLWLTMLVFTVASPVIADDLYRVWISDDYDALRLRETQVTAVVRTSDGFLVLVDNRSAAAFAGSGLKMELLAPSVEIENLAVDIDHDRRRNKRLPILFEEGDLRIFLVSNDYWEQAKTSDQLAPILIDALEISYERPMNYNPRAGVSIADLDSLIGLINQDSLYSYSQRLEAFYRRWAGTDSMMAASAWIKSKFESFGYDSVVFDSFTFYSSQHGIRQCRNVVVTKVGNRHPQWEIIVGAHMDAGQVSPGADDNGSGTVGTLEIARVMADLDTDVTFRFITFDGEEWGLYGSWHYANRAVARGDHIIYMLNMDMIAHYTNDTEANLYYGSNMTFSYLWADLADSLVGITATFNGSSGASDHYPFLQNGYQATFVQEREFSDVYHTVHDSTTYLNYEYMARMVRASMATVFTVNVLPPPVIMTSIIDGGDGQSLQINWLPMDPERIDHYWVYYWPDGSSDLDSMQVSGGSASSALVNGLSEGQLYGFYVLPFNSEGQTSAEYEIIYGTPHSVPGMLTGLGALPMKYGISLSWSPNPELDISHYRIIRDQNLLPEIVTETSFIDDDPDLGNNLHTYLVYAVDIDGHISDTIGAATVTSKAAMMESGRILAINRSHASSGLYLVDETVTGDYLRQALQGYDYDYYSDTAHTGDEKISDLSLYDMIDYEMIIIGGESARLDDLGEAPTSGGRLDTLAYYLSIGGKVIVFGRWGELDFEAVMPYEPEDPGFAYNQYFGITERNLVLTSSSGTELQSDLIGGHAQVSGYPDLVWDSLATVAHSAPYVSVSGVPCISYPTLDQPGIEIIYTYNSSDDGGSTEGQPMAWRNLNPGNQYAYFELPLSFMERGAAAVALSRAVMDFGFASGVTEVNPDVIDVWADEGVTVYVLLGDLVGGYDVFDVDTGTVRINQLLKPAAIEFYPPPPDFDGYVLMMTMSSSEFASFYADAIGDGHLRTYAVSWNYQSEPDTHTVTGNVIVNGYICGDPNTDGEINVGDAVFLIKYVFSGGPQPYPYNTGDVNSEGGANVGDAVYLINYIFKGGDAPNCPE